MKLWWGKDRAVADVVEPVEVVAADGVDGADGGEAPGAMVWTGGPALLTRVMVVGLWAAVACGPVGVGVAVLGLQGGSGAAVSAEGTDWGSGLVAGERAVRAVEVWLAASREDPGDVEALVPGDLALPAVGLGARAGHVASLEPQPGGVWSVVVGVDVAEPVAPADGAGGQSAEVGGMVFDEAGSGGGEVTSVWRRRYFQVPVFVEAREAGPGVVVLAQPAPVAGPATVRGPQGAYPTTVTVTGAAGTSVASFLGALVAGAGDIAPYTTPGVVVTPISPAPYVGVEVRSVSGSGEAPDDPAEGARVHVLASVWLTRPDGQKVPSQYLLELTARAGRWEISGLDEAIKIRQPAGAGVNEESE